MHPNDLERVRTRPRSRHRPRPPRAGRLSAIATLALLAFTAAAGVRAQDDAPQHLPAITLAAGDHAIHAELARSDHERELGLMFRTTLADDDGMLFVYGDPARRCFWMRNTFVALSIAFLEDDGRIVNIVDMAPRTDASRCSTHPVRFVLEMNRGWFARHGLEAGGYVTGEPFDR